MLEDLSREAPSLVPLKLSHDRIENGAVGSSPGGEFQRGEIVATVMGRHRATLTAATVVIVSCAPLESSEGCRSAVALRLLCPSEA